MSRDLMVNVLYQMAGEGDRLGCTPSPPTTNDDDGGCTPSPPNHPNCTPSPPDQGCTPSPGPGTTNPEDEYKAPRQALASLRQQLRETLAQA
ncbi:MAG: hypothetical protein ABIS20_24870 [Thermoanaerobaculia bacterium]